MATKERAVDRGWREATDARLMLGRELREGRIAADLSQHEVGQAVGVSASRISRIERGLAPNVPLGLSIATAAVLGLRVNVRLYPVGQPLRDAGQLALLARLHARLGSGLGWRTEVPLALHGDLRAWDAAIRGPDWIVFVDAETRIRDAQALARRFAVKQRDMPTDRAVLLVSDTRSNRAAIRAIGASLVADALPAGLNLEALAARRDPGGSGVVLL